MWSWHKTTDVQNGELRNEPLNIYSNDFLQGCQDHSTEKVFSTNTAGKTG